MTWGWAMGELREREGASVLSFNGWKFLRLKDLTIARAGVRIERLGVPHHC